MSATSTCGLGISPPVARRRFAPWYLDLGESEDHGLVSTLTTCTQAAVKANAFGNLARFSLFDIQRVHFDPGLKYHAIRERMLAPREKMLKSPVKIVGASQAFIRYKNVDGIQKKDARGPI